MYIYIKYKYKIYSYSHYFRRLILEAKINTQINMQINIV